MRKVFVIISLLLAGFVSVYGTTDSSNESNKNPVELKKEKISESSDRERSIEYSIIEAYSYPESRMVEVTLYNIGNANIRIIDSNNQMVCNETVETDSVCTVRLTVHTVSGIYYLEVVSPSWYAEGVIVF